MINLEILPIGPMNFYQFVTLFADIEKFSINLESPHFFYCFCKMTQMQNLDSDLVMKNQETVMDKSWKNFSQSLWEP